MKRKRDRKLSHRPVDRKTTRRTPRVDNPKVRIPESYPWDILRILLQILRPVLDSDDIVELERVIRLRDRDGLLSLQGTWGLQCMALCVDQPLYKKKAKIQLCSAIRKYPLIHNERERQEAALKQFLTDDNHCHDYNKVEEEWTSNASGGLNPVYSFAQEFIADVVGHVPPDVDELTYLAKHGPGATLESSSATNSDYFKYSEWPYKVTTRCLDLATLAIQADERWLGALESSYRERYAIPMERLLNWDLFWKNVFTVVGYNKVAFVPKDGRKDRPIAIEPGMNMFLQLGVEGYIRKRLKRFGINLDSQVKNQKLAWLGSVDRSDLSPCTIDLSSASDLISLGIAERLFPKAWYKLLCDLRAPCGLLPNGDAIVYGKLSSMGNGSTFAMESLVFSSLAYGACKVALGFYPRERVSVFGDDIVVPQASTRHLLMALESAGFRVNTDKSFVSGPGRESCGSDWIAGHSVRPLSLTEAPTLMTHIYRDRNRLKRMLWNSFGLESSELDDYFASYCDTRLVGPISDTEFDTYWHSDQPSKAVNWSYKFSAIVAHYPTLGGRRNTYAAIPDKVEGEEFLFRKLMARLGTGTPANNTFDKKVKFRKGSVFSLWNTKFLRYKRVRRSTAFWQRIYRQDLTFSPR